MVSILMRINRKTGLKFQGEKKVFFEHRKKPLCDKWYTQKKVGDEAVAQGYESGPRSDC